MNLSMTTGTSTRTHVTVGSQAAAEDRSSLGGAGRSENERSATAADVRAMIGALSTADRVLLEAAACVDERKEHANPSGPRPVGCAAARRASGAATVAAQRRLRYVLRNSYPGLRKDVEEAAHRLGTVVAREVGEEVLSELFGDLAWFERALVLWLAGDYRVQHGCIGRTGTLVFEQVCRELVDADGVLPADLGNALQRHGCRLGAQADVLARHPRLWRMGGRWVMLDGTSAERAAAALAALGRPATLDELRDVLGRPRLTADAVLRDPRVTECTPNTFVRRARAATPSRVRRLRACSGGTVG